MSEIFTAFVPHSFDKGYANAFLIIWTVNKGRNHSFLRTWRMYEKIIQKTMNDYLNTKRLYSRFKCIISSLQIRLMVGMEETIVGFILPKNLHKQWYAYSFLITRLAFIINKQLKTTCSINSPDYMILKQFNQLDCAAFLFSSYMMASFLQNGSCFWRNKSKIFFLPQQAMYYHLNKDQVVFAMPYWG